MSDLQKIKEQVSIRDVAESLLHLEKQDGKYKYPGERTASIQLYTDTQSFNDFGRNVGGDIFKLVSHIEGIDFKESLDEIVNFFQIRDVENKDEESSRPRWINYLEEKKKCRYIEHYNYSLISLKGEYLGYAFTKVRVMHQIKKKDDNGDEVLIWDKTLIYGTLNGDYIKCKILLLQCAAEVYPNVCDELYCCIVIGMSYDKMNKKNFVPLDRKDFYAYRKKTLAVFREALKACNRYPF